MKAKLTAAAFLLSVVFIPLSAADAVRGASVEERFQTADVDLAVIHYKKLRMAALNVSLRVATEKGLSDEERKNLALIQDELEGKAQAVRHEAIKKGQSDVAARAR
jgi:hypothetical protein